MSMLLFALIMNPLLCLMERNLTGMRVAHRTQKTAIVVYADDATIFVTPPKDKRHQGPPIDIRKGGGCLFEHPQIQSHCSGIVGYILKYA
jgi:hypothetical protein